MKLDTTAALISVDEAKEYLGAQGQTQDEIIKTFLNAVGVWMSAYLGRESLLAKNYTEYYNGNGGRHLILRNTPIISITSVDIDSLRLWDSTAAVNVNADVMTNKAAGILTAWNNLRWWSCGQANIKVVYRAGYELDSMPHDIRLAVKRLVDLHFRTGFTSRRLDVSSETIGETTTTFRETDVPKDVRSMLARYMSNSEAPGFAYAD